jgi:hypothetical protein
LNQSGERPSDRPNPYPFEAELARMAKYDFAVLVLDVLIEPNTGATSSGSRRKLSPLSSNQASELASFAASVVRKDVISSMARVTRSISAPGSSSWRFTPPPRSLLAAAAQPVHAHIHAEKAMADLQIKPTSADGRQITVSLLDGEFGPLPAKEVMLVLSKPEAGIEPLRLPATHVEATIWRIDGVRLPISGRWHARVEILVSDFEKITIEDEIELR